MMLMEHSSEAGIMHVQGLMHHPGVPAQHEGMVNMADMRPMVTLMTQCCNPSQGTLGNPRHQFGDSVCCHAVIFAQHDSTFGLVGTVQHCDRPSC